MICVIAKTPWENGGRDLQTNSAWEGNPYGESHAIVPDELVAGIMETRGFCDIELTEDGAEVVAFTALPIPEFPEQEEQDKPTAPRNIVAGEYVTIDNVLYLATENIPNGEPIIVGQNAIKTTVEEQLAELAKGE